MRSGEVGAGSDELGKGEEGQVQERVLDGGAGHGRRSGGHSALGLARLMPVDANHLVVFGEVTGLSERPPTARLEWGCRTVVESRSRRRGMRQRGPVMGGGRRMDVSRAIHQHITSKHEIGIAYFVGFQQAVSSATKQ